MPVVRCAATPQKKKSIGNALAAFRSARKDLFGDVSQRHGQSEACIGNAGGSCNEVQGFGHGSVRSDCSALAQIPASAISNSCMDARCISDYARRDGASTSSQSVDSRVSEMSSHVQQPPTSRAMTPFRSVAHAYHIDCFVVDEEKPLFQPAVTPQTQVSMGRAFATCRSERTVCNSILGDADWYRRQSAACFRNSKGSSRETQLFIGTDGIHVSCSDEGQIRDEATESNNHMYSPPHKVFLVILQTWVCQHDGESPVCSTASRLNDSPFDIVALACSSCTVHAAVWGVLRFTEGLKLHCETFSKLRAAPSLLAAVFACDIDAIRHRVEICKDTSRALHKALILASHLRDLEIIAFLMRYVHHNDALRFALRLALRVGGTQASALVERQLENGADPNQILWSIDMPAPPSGHVVLLRRGDTPLRWLLRLDNERAKRCQSFSVRVARHDIQRLVLILVRHGALCRGLRTREHKSLVEVLCTAPLS